ncbi:MAG: hypothetical protein PHT03_08550 [Bacilli bacterium]|nr:hypothetical protein [Bacilli bacterium]
MYILSQNNQNVKKENKFIPLLDLITKCKDYSKELTRKTLVDFFRAIDYQFSESKIWKENFKIVISKIPLFLKKDIVAIIGTI